MRPSSRPPGGGQIGMMRLFPFGGLLKDLYRHVVDRSIVKYYKASVGPRLDVHSDVLAKLIVDASEIVAYCLNRYVQLVGDAVGASIGQTVFQSAELVEGDGLAHGSMGLMVCKFPRQKEMAMTGRFVSPYLYKSILKIFLSVLFANLSIHRAIYKLFANYLRMF